MGAYDDTYSDGFLDKGDSYIAPMYNSLIEEKMDVRYFIVKLLMNMEMC